MNLSEKFYRTWLSVMDEIKSDLFNASASNKEYTKLIIHDNDSALVKIGKILDYKCYNADYYYTDAVFYKEQDILSEHPDAFYLTDIRIAFEHENVFNSGLFQEVCHLLQVNSELKVLVSYPPNSESETSELQYLHKIITRSSNSNHISDMHGFLVIMGYMEPYTWNGWIFKSDGWIKL
ncbi:hypothetical protein [Aeromonas enteropelogenes]|uniref:hypothetical protein n=1 Tax=Aeromonas enteropelogenes TaxID=29489 RepID=UPI003BA2EB56